jgi:glycosyltransferase involved in cell wall biosynthesis
MEFQTPAVSIVTPTYNRASLLPRAWSSICRQDISCEWVIVDDGSRDNTVEVVRAFDDERIRFFPLPRNCGVNHARNFGASQARAPYVVFLDSDDELYPGGLQIMVETMCAAPAQIGAALFGCIAGHSGKQTSIMTDGLILDEYAMVCGDALKGDMILIYRQDVLKRHRLPEDLKGCEGLFLLDIAKEYDFLMVDKPGSIYHRQDDNLSNATSVVNRSPYIAEYYERLLANHVLILQRCPEAKSRYLLKTLYRYSVSQQPQMAWQAYRRLWGHTRSATHLLAGAAMLLGGRAGLAAFETRRLNRINRRLGR